MTTHSFQKFIESTLVAPFDEPDDEGRIAAAGNHLSPSLRRLRTAVVLGVLVGLMTVVSVAVIVAPAPAAFLIACGLAAAWCWWLEGRSNEPTPIKTRTRSR